MAITLQTPPFRIPMLDDNGHMPDVWQRFFLDVSNALTTNAAPADAPFVISKANTSLTAPVNLGLLASGYLKIATALSIATVSTVATVPTTDLSGVLQAAQEPAHTGDVTNSAGSLALAIGALKVTNAMLAGLIDLATKVTGILPATSHPALTGDVTTPSGSVATSITALAVTNAMLAGSIDLATKVTGILPAADFPALTGDVTTIAGALATTIGALKVTNAMLAGSIDLASKVTGILPAADFPALTGDVTTVSGALATTIGALKVTNAMLAGSIAYSKLVLTGAILNADLAGSIAASKLIGTDIATVGTLTAGATGAGFTVALSTSTITGTLADARLSANIPLINAANTFSNTGTNSFAGPLSATKVSLPNTGGAATSGQLTLVAGTKTVNTTAATATALVFFQRFTAGGTIGFATTYTVSVNTSFTVSSDNILDTSTYNWWIVETH